MGSLHLFVIGLSLSWTQVSLENNDVTPAQTDTCHMSCSLPLKCLKWFSFRKLNFEPFNVTL